MLWTPSRRSNLFCLEIFIVTKENDFMNIFLQNLVDAGPSALAVGKFSEVFANCILHFIGKSSADHNCMALLAKLQVSKPTLFEEDKAPESVALLVQNHRPFEAEESDKCEDLAIGMDPVVIEHTSLEVDDDGAVDKFHMEDEYLLGLVESRRKVGSSLGCMDCQWEEVRSLDSNPSVLVQLDLEWEVSFDDHREFRVCFQSHDFESVFQDLIFAKGLYLTFYLYHFYHVFPSLFSGTAVQQGENLAFYNSVCLFVDNRSRIRYQEQFQKQTNLRRAEAFCLRLCDRCEVDHCVSKISQDKVKVNQLSFHVERVISEQKAQLQVIQKDRQGPTLLNNLIIQQIFCQKGHSSQFHNISSMFSINLSLNKQNIYKPSLNVIHLYSHFRFIGFAFYIDLNDNWFSLQQTIYIAKLKYTKSQKPKNTKPKFDPQITKKMPIPPQCANQYCPLQCCDINGYCPSIQADCHYFYNQDYYQLAPGVIVAIVIGCVCAFTIAVMIICFFFKRYKRRRIEPGSPRRMPQGALPNMPPNVIIAQRNEPSYGTDSFQDLIMAENRRVPYPQPNSDPPSRNDAPYFQPNAPQNNINQYYNA